MKKLLLLFILINTSLYASNSGEKLYQVSTIDALLAGYYDGDKTVSQLKDHGDFGLGTFDGIDGEMVVYEGDVYQVKSTGKIIQPDDTIGVPFASVHFFKPDITKSINNIKSYDQLKSLLNNFEQCKNYPCGFKIEGVFSYVKTRSAPKASKPYPTLAKHITDTQNFFEAKNIKGVLIGYYLPEYFGKFNVPGYHFHFLSQDKKFGGHVLKVALKDGQLSLDQLYDVDISLLRTKEFHEGKLESRSKDLEKVEKEIKN
jgi:acetolactate decarboxylase